MAATVGELLADARWRLRAAPFRPSGREAALLLGQILGLGEAAVLARAGERLEPAAADRFERLLERRLSGEPIAYLLGEKEFYGRTFAVDSRVLIPRPESEHLIEAALACELPERPRLLEVGTGSGCLALTLALEIPGARVTAVDLSPAALAVAAANARRLGAGRGVRLAAMDIAAALELDGFDLALSNPPYVGPEEIAALSPEVREHEPALALFAPGEGGSVLARLLDELAGLRPGTPLLLEIGYRQRELIAELAAGSAFELLRVEPDYAGHPRIATLRRR